MDDEIKKYIDDKIHELRLELLQYLGELNAARDVTRAEIIIRLENLEK